MLSAPLLRRTLCATTALALCLPAGAQTVETPTPPARVGQIAGLVGNVSFNGASSNGAWVAAEDNYPLTSGDSLYTQAGAEAAVALDSSRLFIAPLSEIQVTSLDDQDFGATQAQGEMVLKLSALDQGQSFTINTPGGAVTMATSGTYDIITGPVTTIAVLSGQAMAGNVTLTSGQAAELSNGQAQVTPLQEDGFVRHVLGTLSPPPPPYVPQVAYQMTGIDELTNYGSWDQDPNYGAIWYPAVDVGWAPYREGAWSYVAPWGWTWVEAEPWGFAPFHYGRWIHRGERWGWVPAADREEAAGYTPVYAPAVVTFFGLAAGAAITADIIASGRIGWVPLAPGEAYHPPYRASDAYIQRINRIDVSRSATIDARDVTIDHFANRAGATYVPAAAMARGERIGRAGGGAVPPGALEQARPAGELVDRAVRPAMTARPAEAPRPAEARPAMSLPRPDAGRPGMAAPAPSAGAEGQRMPNVIRPQETRPEGVRPEGVRPEQARPAVPGVEAPRVEAPRAEAPRAEMPRTEMPRVESPRVVTPQDQAPRFEARPPEAIQAPRLEAPHVQNAAPFAGGQAPRIEAPRPAPPRPAEPRPPGPINNPHPPG